MSTFHSILNFPQYMNSMHNCTQWIHNHLWILLFVLIYSGIIIMNMHVFGRAYKMFGIILCIFSQSISVTSYAKIKLYSYTSLIRSQLTYCSISYWQLHLITSSTKGNHANSYLLNKYSSIIISKITLFNVYFWNFGHHAWNLIPSVNFNINHYSYLILN